MGIRMHIFTARDLIHLRQSRPSGHGITDREGGWAVLRRGQHLSGKKSVSPLGAGCPGHPGPVPLAGDKERARVTSRKPCGDWTHGLLQPKARPSGMILLRWKWGLTATLAVPVPLFGERRDKNSPIRSRPIPAVRGFSRLRFPFISSRRPPAPRGKEGSAPLGTGPWCPRGSPRRGRQQKGGKEGQRPPFPGGIPAPSAARCLRKRNAAGARRYRSRRPREGSVQHPRPWLGLCGVVPAASAPAGRAPPVSRIPPPPRKRNVPAPPHPVPSGGPLQFHLVSSSFPCK